MTAHADPLSTFRLDCKVSLVTGGGSGIGARLPADWRVRCVLHD